MSLNFFIMYICKILLSSNECKNFFSVLNILIYVRKEMKMKKTIAAYFESLFFRKLIVGGLTTQFVTLSLFREVEVKMTTCQSY